MKTAIIGASVAALTLASPSSAATDTFQFRGENAYAQFRQESSDGCASTVVDVWAYNDVVRNEPGPPTRQSRANVSYGTYNWCTGSFSGGYGSSTDVTFNANANLSSASLTATVPVFDYSNGSTKNITVAVNWTGTGEVSRGRENSSNSGPGYVYRSRYNGSSRQAQASGSITLDGSSLFTNAAANFGYLGSSSSGSVTITRKTR